MCLSTLHVRKYFIIHLTHALNVAVGGGTLKSFKQISYLQKLTFYLK